MTQRQVVTVQVGGGLGNQLFGLVAGLWASHELSCGLDVDVSAARPQNLARGEVGHFAERDVELDSFHLPTAGDGSAINLVERPFRPPFRGEMRLRRAASRLRFPSREYWPTPWVVDHRILAVAKGRLLRGNFHTWGYWQRFRDLGGFIDLTPLQPTEWFHEMEVLLDEEKPVALHVRLGDYVKVLPQLVSSLDFIEDAVGEVFQLVGERPIWLFSDDPQAARHMVGSLRERHRIRAITPPLASRAVESLVLMSQASGIVCSASSFSIWASQFADALTPIVLPHSAEATFGRDGFHPSWIVLPSDGKSSDGN